MRCNFRYFTAAGLLAAALLTPARPARAQGFTLGTPVVSLPVLVLTPQRYDERTGRYSPATPAGKASGAKAPASFGYAPTAAGQTRAVEAFARGLEGTDPAAARRMRTTYAPPKFDYNQVYNNIVRGSGLSDRDAADATAAFFAYTIRLVNEPAQQPVVAPAAARALRQRLLGSLGQAARTPAAVAQLGEDMKLRLVWLYAGWLGARQDGTLPAFQQSLVAGFRQKFGFDPTQYNLTPQGLVKR